MDRDLKKKITPIIHTRGSSHSSPPRDSTHVYMFALYYYIIFLLILLYFLLLYYYTIDKTLVCCDFRCDTFDCRYETLFNAPFPWWLYCEGKKASWHIILILKPYYSTTRPRGLQIFDYRIVVARASIRRDSGSFGESFRVDPKLSDLRA